MKHVAVTMDPVVPNWEQVSLDDTWVDGIDLRSLRGLRRLVHAVMGKRQRVQVPPAMPGAASLPAYIFYEFHNIPNGNYSRRLSRGYITGFDVSMRGWAERAREWIAAQLSDCDAVLDVGTSGGKTAAAVASRGVSDVWGLDPSPYLLKHAAADFPELRFVQGVAEQLPFPDERFDGIASCFLFHEIPPRQVEAALRSFNRVLRPGGRVAITEPSESQLERFTLREFFTRRGWLRVYFRALAGFVSEPYLVPWHAQDKEALFRAAGFETLKAEQGMPINAYLIRKVGPVPESS